MRRRTVAPAAFYDDVDAVHVSERHSLRVADVAVGDDAVAVDGESVIRLWKLLEQAGLDHLSRAGTAFFGRLADEDERSLPVFFHARQYGGRSEPCRHVHVVAAGVHDADLVA